MLKLQCHNTKYLINGDGDRQIDKEKDRKENMNRVQQQRKGKNIPNDIANDH